MKQKPQQSKSAAAQAPRKRSVGDIAILVGFFALPAILVYWVAQRSPPRPPTSAPATQSTPQSAASAKAPTANPATPLLTSMAAPAATPPAATPPIVTPLPLVDPVKDVSELVPSLTEIDVASAPLTSEQVALWKQHLQRLIQQGPAAVPAIREFLAKNVDLDFDSAPGGNLLGYSTARLALLDALRQINGPESIAGSLQVLQTTADPREIGTVAKNLEQQAPSQHRAAAVTAAREALSAAARGQLEGHDVGPLFEILQQFGGATAASDLEQVASMWNFYSTIALGGLPAGAGIPALTRLARDNALPNTMSYRILAQSAGKYPEAKAFLISQIRSNAMPYSAWTGVTAALSGEVIDYATPLLIPPTTSLSGQNIRTYHINYGHQNYRTVPMAGDWPEAQVKQQLALIDDVIAVDANMETLQFLQDARLTLAGKVNK